MAWSSPRWTGKHRFFQTRPCKLLANAHIAPTAPKPGHGMGGNYAEPTAAVSGRPDDQGDHKAAQRAMRRKAAAVRGRHNRPHTRPPSSFRCNMRHQHTTHDHKQHLAASRRGNSSTEGLQQHPERMTRGHLGSEPRRRVGRGGVSAPKGGDTRDAVS